MTQGDGFKDDTCDCGYCQAGIAVIPPEAIIYEGEATALEILAKKVIAQQHAIDDLVSRLGYLPEAQAILAKHGLNS
jgi:hypothetical protein